MFTQNGGGMHRRCYHIFDWNSTDYSEGPTKSRVPVLEGDPLANAWSSQTVENANWHMPVLDIDVLCTPGVRAAVEAVFPGVRWVRSTHNFHAYVDTPMPWAKFLDRMNLLVQQGIVEGGYQRASVARGAAFVRMPGVVKGTGESAEARWNRVNDKFRQSLKIEHTDMLWLLAVAHTSITKGPF